MRWLVPGLDPALTFRGWLDTRTLPFPGEPDRICDTVAGLARGPTAEPEWALVIEFQAEPDPDMLERLLEYLARLRRELRPGPERRRRYAVVGVLVTLTGPVQPDTLEVTLPQVPGVGLRFQVVQPYLAGGGGGQDPARDRGGGGGPVPAAVDSPDA